MTEAILAGPRIQSVAVVGTGVIGASWAAYYLARGFDVIATDPAPNAEANLRAYVKDAWELLKPAGLAEGASLDRLSFASNLKAALRRGGFCSGKRTGETGLQN